MGVLEKLRRRYNESVFLRAFYNNQVRKKISIKLYYLDREGLFDQSASCPEPKISPLKTFFLGPSDMKNLAAVDERDFAEREMLDMLSEGRKCLGIKHNDELVANVWVNFIRCHSRLLTFPLKENEAYLYGARTFRKYRGKNIAPYLRYQLYTHLQKMGRIKLYSITEFNNISSIKFKQKLGTRRLKLYLNIQFLDKYRCNFILRNYTNT